MNKPNTFPLWNCSGKAMIEACINVSHAIEELSYNLHKLKENKNDLKQTK